jgi:AcrR family transcriptional regulator
MPQTRSRLKTEEKFLSAVLELVADKGCSALGINAVAHVAGADKVLIYRYFKNLNGLLERVAESRNWLPTVSESLKSLSLSQDSKGTDVLHQIARLLIHHIRADKTTHQLVCWRKAEKNPLTDYFSNEWQAFWRELPDALSIGLDYESRENWKQASSLTALIVEAELCDEPVDFSCLNLFAKEMHLGQLSEAPPDPSDYGYDDQLPTKLL